MYNYKEMPIVVNDFMETEFNRVARKIVESYEKYVYPVLFRFGLLDDEHIKKYLSCSTMEEIYKDAVLKDGEKLAYLEKEAIFNDNDLWEPIRDKRSPVKNPKEDGFIFAQLPIADYSRKRFVLKALSVKDCKISIDKDILQKMCIVTPTEKQRELYKITAEYCEKLEKLNNTKTPYSLLYLDEKCRVIPNTLGIIGSTFCSIKANYPK